MQHVSDAYSVFFCLDAPQVGFTAMNTLPDAKMRGRGEDAKLFLCALDVCQV